MKYGKPVMKKVGLVRITADEISDIVGLRHTQDNEKRFCALHCFFSRQTMLHMNQRPSSGVSNRRGLDTKATPNELRSSSCKPEETSNGVWESVLYLPQWTILDQLDFKSTGTSHAQNYSFTRVLLLFLH